MHNNLGQNGGGGGAVASDVIGLGSGLFQKLRAHILIRVGQFDLFGYGHAIVGDSWGAIFLVECHIAALGA